MPNADKGPRRHEFRMPSTGEVVPVYAGAKVGRALEEVTRDMTLYQGVRLEELLEELLEALYKQGKKDGAGLPNPGRPRSLPEN